FVEEPGELVDAHGDRRRALRRPGLAHLGIAGDTADLGVGGRPPPPPPPPLVKKLLQKNAFVVHFDHH
ncbi:MAG: hypothetical protein RL538_823, partial [Candidatus Parcubacteria bacterium]